MRKTWALILLASIALADAAYVFGDIYQGDLQKLNRTAIRIEGDFTYQLVADKANYSIFLPEGNYTISASSADSGGNDLRSLEKVSVGPQDQRVDLVLKPAFPPGYAISLIAIASLIVVFLWSNRHWGRKSAQPALRPESQTASESRPSAAVKIELDGDAKAVLRALDGTEGRATQKELREALGYSDAKLSLILTELEAIGRVKKFKRGRANIIRKL